MSYQNYGDVALDLPATWDRRQYDSAQQVIMTIGHTDGVADAYRKKEPAARHQFNWINPKDETDLTHKQTQGYEFCHKDVWDKNKTLWRWNDSGYIEYKGCWLAARPAELYEADKALRERERNRDLKKEADEKIAASVAGGLNVTDLNGNALRPTTRK